MTQVFTIFAEHIHQCCEVPGGTFEAVIIGHWISAAGVATDRGKIKTVEELPDPENPKQMWSFLGLAGYYPRFVRASSNITRLLMQPLKKNAFSWSLTTQGI